jgi:membrane-bound serine protease (ClpP class)
MHEEKQNMYDDTLIGAQGRVLTPLKPIGTIQLHGETWTATSDSAVETGEEVVVVERNGLQLLVAPLKEKHAPENG